MDEIYKIFNNKKKSIKNLINKPMVRCNRSFKIETMYTKFYKKKKKVFDEVA